jgi:hypothetical protein
MINNVRKKMKKENPPNKFGRFGALVARKKDILGCTDAAQLQRRSSDAVMVTADVLTAHFGIHRRCNRISPIYAVVFTDPTGWDGVKNTKAAENVYNPLEMMSLVSR